MSKLLYDFQINFHAYSIVYMKTYHAVPSWCEEDLN